MAGTILIADDNKNVLTSLELLLDEEFRQVVTVSNPNLILNALRDRSVEGVILDMNFSTGVNNGNEGLYWLQRILEQRPGLPVIMLTAYGDIDLAVKALKYGACDFVLKPWDNAVLIEKIRAALAAAKQVAGVRRSVPEMLIGNSPVMLKLTKVIGRVARTDANILITGENGTGKEMVAREIHRLSLRSHRELFGVDMGAVSESLFESELFGHEKGAFTDARESKPGKFEEANGSTLFLDEIGNLSPHLQMKLLTVLQNREVVRLGSNRKIPVDIRLVAATNGDLPEMVARKAFREDLFYRINTIHLVIPPLRERREDIPMFADFFLKKYISRYQHPGLELHPQAMEKLQRYDWPGNVRELQHLIEKVVILAERNEIRPNDLILSPVRSSPPVAVSRLDEIEKLAIETAIRQNDGNLTAAAEQLGISRQTLYNKLKRFYS